ncbi:unnamed protein product [Hermetia illucens]|uniref:Uncharacterized protein n=1 Tax=Hermetia illucens TaxID=343691 RepID=A0A7R8V1N2_HERIL|nr:uncharacterized protein LOC119656498 isoform X2 [Hermetia illucens]CAD7091216.1 unnamed protein product [Hermetia illucens]
MAKRLNIGADALEKLEYDSDMSGPGKENSLKMTPYCTNKFTVPRLTADAAATKIKDNLSLLASIESEQNCLPKHIAESQINLALSFFLGINRLNPKKSGVVPSVSPLYDASSGFSIFEVVHNVLLAFDCGYYSIDIKFNASREKFLHEFFCTTLGGQNLTPKEPWETFPEDETVEEHIPYSTMFVFDSGDLDAAAHTLASSFDDPVIPWRIRSVYVQEACYEDFVAKLKPKLRSYPPEILRDSAFTALFNEGMETLKKIKAKTIQPDSQHASGPVVPTICCEFSREQLDKPTGLSPIVVLKAVRTAKEAVTLAKNETGGMASIWTEKIALAYELVNSLNYNTFWINCIGKLNVSIPFTFRNYKNCVGSDFAPIEWFVKHSYIEGQDYATSDSPMVLDALKGASKVENSYHFEYFSVGSSDVIKSQSRKNKKWDALLDLVDLSDIYWRNVYVAATQWKRKTVVFPFGVTFAN